MAVETGRSPYGAKGPLPEPAIFAEGAISTGDFDLNSAFTPDGHTLYFTKAAVDTKLGVIVVSRFQEGKWKTPVVASFSGRFTDFDPFITPDGSKLFFCSDRPGPGKEKRDFDIWYVEKNGTSWTEPRNVGAPVNTSGNEYYPSVAQDGTLYFSSDRAGGKGGYDIYRSRVIQGHYSEPENLGPAINTQYGEIDNYISPDQSWLIFVSTRPEGLGSSDLYISYEKDGSWTPAKNLGSPINTNAREFCPMVSPDGKYLFFTSTRSIVAKDRTSALTYRGLRALLAAPGHGLGDIYQVDIEAVHRAGRGH
jgi:Tol biopolymer transport system component